MLKLAAFLLVIIFTVTACPSKQDLDEVMGRSVAGTPVPAPQTVHCDLIFPGTDRR